MLYIYGADRSVPLRDHDHLKLQFLGARDAWFGCPDSVCDLRRCPSVNDNYLYSDGRCWGEDFQIFAEGPNFNPIKSGQRIMLRYPREHQTWMGCPAHKRCDKRTCPGSTTTAKSRIDNCWGEVFNIYARGKRNGAVINNGDVVMIYYPREGLYVSIQGENDHDDTSINFCPAAAPPSYFSYAICSKNAFRIYVQGS